MDKTDAQLKADVLEELKWDTRVRETDVGVEVRSGVVTLTGRVDSWAARESAQEAAHRVCGVLDVANDVRVRASDSAERDDADIAKAVRQTLEWDVRVPDAAIRSTVANGVATLEGTVDSWTQHEDAARAVRNLAGVQGIRNLVQVEPATHRASPVSIRAAIEHVLARRAAQLTERVHLRVADDTVVLSGSVPTWADWQAVERAVRGTRGVGRVDNQLRIQR